MDSPETQAILGTIYRTKTNKTHNTTQKEKIVEQHGTPPKYRTCIRRCPRRVDSSFSYKKPVKSSAVNVISVKNERQ
jgi:hypothetical protein